MGPSESPWHLAAGVRATVPVRLRSGALVHLWRPGPPPHLDAWYEPAWLFGTAVADDRCVAVGHLDPDDVTFVGRLDGPAGPRWLYRHADGGELLLDLDGRPWVAIPCRRSRSGYRLRSLTLAAAVAALADAAVDAVAGAADAAAPTTAAPRLPPHPIRRGRSGPTPRPATGAAGLAVVLPFRPR